MKKNNDYASPAKVAWYARNLLRKLNLAIIVVSLSIIQVAGATKASGSAKNNVKGCGKTL